MAIDTEAKRRSVQSYWFGLPLPPADGAIGVADRAALTWLYSGLGYAPPPAGGGGLNWLIGLSPTRGLSILRGLSPYVGMNKPSKP